VEQKITSINQHIADLQNLENKIKKKISTKEFQETLTSTKDDFTKQNSLLTNKLQNIKQELKLIQKSKLNKEDLSYLLIQKVDTQTFSDQIDLLTESLIALKKKMTLVESQSEL
jgi:retron-type reverse transcriptase